jgi:hypothetical protein
VIFDAMSDSHATESPAEPLFTVAEVEQLTNDDAIAGRAIGKMLSALFLYTVVAMIIVTSWTYWSVVTNHTSESVTDAASAPAH